MTPEFADLLIFTAKALLIGGAVFAFAMLAFIVRHWLLLTENPYKDLTDDN